MVQPIMKDQFFLSRSSVPATEADQQVGLDLLDTLEAHRDGCVGMAANMIGENRSIIVFDNEEGGPQLMLNPVIVDRKQPYETEEGCLSLPGERKTVRYERITVSWQDLAFLPHKKDFEGFTAQIIQHEVDHLMGILI